VRARATLLAAGIAALLSFLPGPPAPAKETREERVRKFQDSLGQEVVRDSGLPVPPGKRGVVIEYAVLIAGGGIVLVVLVHTLLSRMRARREGEESRRTYLTENLMTPEAIADHLRRVTAGKIPMSAWIDEHFIRFSTRIEEIPEAEGAIAILPLSPGSGNEMLRNSKSVRFEYLYEKVPYRFESAWREERGHGGAFHHLCALPESIHFTQRRDYYRIEPPLSAPVACTFQQRGALPQDVFDIGLGGFSIVTSERFRPGEEANGCKIAGARLLPIEVSAKCIYELPLKDARSKFGYRFGFRFTRLPAGGAKRLTHFLSSQQVADLSRRKSMEQ
jgi:c-di-GMP-binding flagellar brake protein YcgR